MGANLNGDVYAPGLMAEMIRRMKEKPPALELLDHIKVEQPKIGYDIIGIDPAGPGPDETAVIGMTVSTFKQVAMHHNVGLNVVHPIDPRDAIRDAWLRAHTYVDTDLSKLDLHVAEKLIDSSSVKVLAEMLKIRQLHPAFGILDNETPGLVEDGTQDECKESIEHALDSAVAKHFEIISHGLTDYEINVVNFEITYTPPRLKIMAKTKRPRMQVNGIMTSPIVRRLMNSWVTITVDGGNWSKIYDYQPGLTMRHIGEQAQDENKGIHFFKGDEELSHFDLTSDIGTHGKFKMTGVWSGRVTRGAPLVDYKHRSIKILHNA